MGTLFFFLSFFWFLILIVDFIRGKFLHKGKAKRFNIFISHWAIMLCLFFIGVFVESPNTISFADYRFSTANLNVRSGPSITSELREPKLEPGEDIFVLKDSAGWLAISRSEYDSSVAGWVAKKYTSPVEDKTDLEDGENDGGIILFTFFFLLLAGALVAYLVSLLGKKRKKKVLGQIELFEKKYNVKLDQAEKIFHSKVVGVKHKNKNGVSRQKVIKNLKEQDILQFIREPSNQYDADAIRVLTMRGVQIGFIKAENAATLAPQMDRGDVIFGQINEITGGEGNKSYGVNIDIFNGGRPAVQN